MDPDCFGRYPAGNSPCAKCEYFDSCRYYTKTEKKVLSRSKLASYDMLSNVLPDMPDFDHVPGWKEPEDGRNGIIDALGRFFRFLLELDEYTLGILREIIVPGGEKCSVTLLGKLRGCSRQAIHRKILFEIARHPELSAVFIQIMDKLGASRRQFMRKNSAAAKVNL